MKNLKDWLKEEFATPGNTVGMGNVAAPSMDNVQVGSGDIPPHIDFKTGKITKRKKRFKRYKI